MSLNRTLQSLKIASLFGSVLGLGFGCVVTLSPLEPCDSGSNNKLDDSGECECRIGYEWCDPTDQSNLNCCDDDGGTSGPGDGDPGDGDPGDGDPGDGDGDPGDGDGDPGDGDGDGDGDACAPPELPPETCEPGEEGFAWCTNSDPNMPQCGDYYVCIGGAWTLSQDLLEGDCQFIGFDFAYGCWDDAANLEVVQECGDGSGLPCTDADPTICQDPDVISYCYWDHETWDSCLDFCQTEGIRGQTYEWGECDDVTDPNDVQCFCCDQGDPGCPL